MIADRKAAERAVAIVAAKNIDIGTNNAATTRRVVHSQDAYLNQCPASTVRKPTTAINHPDSDGVGSGNQRPSTAQAVQALRHTKTRSKLTSAKAKSAAGTTHSPQPYDIVAFAQMVVAKLPIPKVEADRDYISVGDQSYAMRPPVF